MQGLPDKTIARRLERSVGTAKSHVKAILMKLETARGMRAHFLRSADSKSKLRSESSTFGGT